MSRKQRLKQLEKKAHGQFLAFFALPRGLCNRKEMESQLWDDYVKNGGNKTATPAFLPIPRTIMALYVVLKLLLLMTGLLTTPNLR